MRWVVWRTRVGKCGSSGRPTKTAATSRLLIRETPLQTHPLQLSLYQYFPNSQQKGRKSCSTDSLVDVFISFKVLNWPKKASNANLHNWIWETYIEGKAGFVCSYSNSYSFARHCISLYTIYTCILSLSVTFCRSLRMKWWQREAQGTKAMTSARRARWCRISSWPGYISWYVMNISILQNMCCEMLLISVHISHHSSLISYYCWLSPNHTTSHPQSDNIAPWFSMIHTPAAHARTLFKSHCGHVDVWGTCRWCHCSLVGDSWRAYFG